MLRESFKAFYVYIRKEERLKINNVNTYRRKVKKNSKLNSKKKMREMIRPETKDIENRQLRSSTKPQVGSFKRLRKLINP